tara:strand:+ start:5838 stop:6023 length:186 start_codon:yes stop_codon:yes gene_type:complete
MEELVDLLAADESPAQVSDKIKDILFAKSAEKISDLRPQVAASVFDDPRLETEEDSDESEE